MKKRIVFMGTPKFAVPSLEALVQEGFDVVAVVSQPDKPKGRGLEKAHSPVKEAALRLGLVVIEPAKIRDEDFINGLKSLRPDFIAVVAYGKILPLSILSLPHGGCINLHSSILPGYRGAAPINWAIIRGEKETGVSTMVMDEGMDTGPVLLTEKVEIGEEENALELAARLSHVGAKLLTKTLGLLIEGKLDPVPQDESLANYAPILKKEDGRIDWSKTSAEIKNLIRGVYPWPGAYTTWKNKTIKIHSGSPWGAPALKEAAPGTVLTAGKEGILVKTGDSAFEIKELQPENKKRLSAGEFVQGYRIGEGEVFS